MRRDENRIESDKKAAQASDPEVVEEEIYLATVPERVEQEAEENEGKTERWHSFKTP
jgi:hypothetical protein